MWWRKHRNSVKSAPGCRSRPIKTFAAYQSARSLRTARVQTTARFFGDYVLHLHGVNGTLRNSLLAARKSDDFALIDWLYGYRI